MLKGKRVSFEGEQGTLPLRKQWNKKLSCQHLLQHVSGNLRFSNVVILPYPVFSEPYLLFHSFQMSPGGDLLGYQNHRLPLFQAEETLKNQNSFYVVLSRNCLFNFANQVDLDKLRLPDGVSISKISGPVPERRYFPCKETDPAPPRVPGAQTPWCNNPYSGAPPPTYPGPTGMQLGI